MIVSFDGYEGDEELAIAAIKDALAALQSAFMKATKVGKSRLELFLGYHDEESGDRYDDVSGVYWSVVGAYQLSGAGKKYQDYIERKFFVSFG